MFKAAAILAIIISTFTLSGSASAQSQTQGDLRTAREAIDSRLRGEARKRIQEQVERDEARRQEREIEQRRRAGVPEPASSAPVPAATPTEAAPAPAAPPAAAAAPPSPPAEQKAVSPPAAAKEPIRPARFQAPKASPSRYAKRTRLKLNI
jgi:hypothetical protein